LRAIDCLLPFDLLPLFAVRCQTRGAIEPNCILQGPVFRAFAPGAKEILPFDKKINHATVS
jgi:hypothetical protein